VSLEGDTVEALVDGSRMRGSYDSYMVPGVGARNPLTLQLLDRGARFLSMLHLLHTGLHGQHR